MLNYNCFKCGYVAIVVKMNFVVMKINLPQTRNFVGDRICFCECGPTQKFVQSGSEVNILSSIIETMQNSLYWKPSFFTWCKLPRFAKAFKISLAVILIYPIRDDSGDYGFFLYIFKASWAVDTRRSNLAKSLIR